jgi:hypothetical protein
MFTHPFLLLPVPSTLSCSCVLTQRRIHPGSMFLRKFSFLFL